MHIKIRKAWELSENQVTPESQYLRRREFLTESAKAGAGLWLGSHLLMPTLAGAATAKLNPLYNVKDRQLTKEELATSYNNFYEFSLEKSGVKPLAEKWTPKNPWKIEVAGLTEQPRSFDLDELLKLAGPAEERIYRFRCVEAWSMVVPWSGIPLSTLVQKLRPKSTAKYIAFTSYGDEKDFPNIKREPLYPWPYQEGLRLDEAMHPLAFVATGLYGKPLPRQNGAPVRIVVPWKYGFKSIKSIVRIEFRADQPKTLWNQLAAAEYGFYANVNPEVDHPRWSQSSERVLDGKLFPTRVKTLKFNGYEGEVAGLYKDLDLKKNY